MLTGGRGGTGNRLGHLIAVNELHCREERWEKITENPQKSISSEQKDSQKNIFVGRERDCVHSGGEEIMEKIRERVCGKRTFQEKKGDKKGTQPMKLKGKTAEKLSKGVIMVRTRRNRGGAEKKREKIG